MKAFNSLCFLALVATSLANRDLCPHPEDAEVEYVNQFVAVDAIEANAVGVEVDLADFDITHEIISCVSIVPEEDGFGPVAVALGQNRLGGWSVKLLSAESMGIRTSINVYGPDRNNPDSPDSPDEPDSPDGPDGPDGPEELLLRSFGQHKYHHGRKH